MDYKDLNIFEQKREGYWAVLKPLFLPTDPVSNDIINYFASLLRVCGMEDRGWDPYAESRAILNDLNCFMQIKIPEEDFKNPDLTKCRLGLLMYSHIVEMDAPYEVLLNLIRFQLGLGYSPSPFFSFLSSKEQKSFASRGITTGRKIEIIKKLSDQLNLPIGTIFDEFYNSRLRNAISHSDFILTDTGFRCRGGLGGQRSFHIDYEALDDILVSAKAFMAAFFLGERGARYVWGSKKQQAMKYDATYKGLMEVLVDEEGLLCGFTVHWPNNSDSTYRRTENGVEMVNCLLAIERATIELMVGLYAEVPGTFSPLVEFNDLAVYTPLDGTTIIPHWSNNSQNT